MTSNPIIEFANSEFRAEITNIGDGFELRWDDHLANWWTEVYPQLDAAVARLGLIIAASRDDLTFHDDHAGWFERWTQLKAEALS